MMMLNVVKYDDDKRRKRINDGNGIRFKIHLLPRTIQPLELKYSGLREASFNSSIVIVLFFVFVFHDC